MAALASAVIVSAPQAKTFADKQSDSSQAVTEKTIDDQFIKSAESADERKEEILEEENFELESGKKVKVEAKADESSSRSQVLAHPAQATAVTNLGNEIDNSGLQMSEEKPQVALMMAAAQSNEPNYSTDEKEIKDYSGSERYKETDLQPGSTNQSFGNTDENEIKDGFKFETKNPSESSPNKTAYGYQITIDKKTGQRTYTKITVTDSGRVPVDPGSKPMMKPGDKLTPESPGVTYKPNENFDVTKAGRQYNLNYYASEETLKHINNNGNDSTSFGFKDNYTQENPDVKFIAGSFALGYKVNPWPNENDNLEELKLNKNNYDPTSKYFVQGQDIDTGIKVDNIDENAKKRLVGQVYHPVTGEIVPGASAYIADDGNIHIKMPEGALKKDANGKTVINEDSIFNTKEYKGIQQLDVRFFARPRTAEEFAKIAGTPDDFGETGTYVETGAGTADINHKGTNVTIDKQGIDRYDHYNLIGDFKLNLDDTRFYDQSFKDENGEETADRTYINVNPGDPFDVKMFKPENPSKTDKSGEEMNEADKNGEASGKIIMDFINKENEGKAPEDQWKVDVDPHDISKFTITPPASAKAGDFIALPIEYTYTNGSKDIHYFHFVVKESTYIKPEYDTQVNFPVNKQTSPAKVAEDTKRIKPDHYTLPDTLETDDAGNKLATDDKGNKWTVTVDETTGQVTAKPVNPDDFDGGEKLTVPVIAHYKDPQKPDEDITEKANAYFVIEEKANMTPRYNAKAGKEGDTLSSDVILNEEDRYNRRPGKFTLESDTYTDDKGNVWNVSIDETTGKVTATVPNAKDGQSIDGALLNVPVIAHYYEEDENGDPVEAGTKTTEVQFVAYGTNGSIEKTEEIPFETIVEKDPNLKKGEIKVITEGEKGSKKVTYTIEDSKVTKTDEEVTKEATNRVIHVGEGVNNGTHTIEEKVEIPFETEIQFDDSLAPGETKVTQEGAPGEKKRDINLTIQDGKVTKTEEGEFTETKAPKKRIIKVGRNTEGKVEHKEEIPFDYKVEYVDDLKKGEYRIAKPGKVGTKTTTWNIKNSQIDGEPTVTEEAPEDALIQVGKGTNDGTHDIVEKKELPFETRYEYDDSLEPGEEKVVSEGSPGEQERTNTIVIKDGKVVEVKEGTFATTKDPVDRVIKIGRKPTEGEITKKVERDIPFDTKVIYDETLEAGSQVIEKEGKLGKEEVTITQKVKDSKPVGDPTETTKTITEKEDRVVRIGIKPVVKETELGHDTEYRHNPELKEGEQKVIEEGSKGYVKYTTTFNKETGKLEVTEERVEPTNKVVEYGSKTDGEFKFESEKAYDIIIRENPNLEAGKTNVLQEGIVGKTETTVKIENSKEVDRTTKTITEKQDKIIEIGTKNVCEIPPVNPNPNPDPDPDPEPKPNPDPNPDPEPNPDPKPNPDPDPDPEPNPDPKPDPEPGKPEDPKDPEPGKPGDKDPETPGKPGDKDPENPGKPGDKDPETPGKPGDKDPEPGKPGDKDPENPGKPGDKDPEPGKPGDKDPETPGKPGDKDPETPGKPGDKDPETPGKTPEENGKTPENNGKKPGATGQVEGKEKADIPHRKSSSKLPKSGSESEIMTLAMSGLLTAAGFVGLKKKRKDR